MGIASDLRASVLQAAIQGKLTEQLSTDGNARDLLAKIKAEKEQLIKDKKIKKEKALAPISDDEKPFDIPENWEWSRIGDLVDCSAGSTPQRGCLEYWTNGTIPWLKTGELTDSYITECEEKITEKAFQKCSLRMNHSGDILIALYGATIGKLGIVTFDLTTNQACLGCTTLNGLYNMYLFMYFKAIKEDLIGRAEGGAQPNISREKVRNALIALPPLAEQERIVERVDALMKEIAELEKIETELEHIKKEFPNDMKAALLQSAMQGKLTQQLVSDGRASEIFHNIGVEPIRDTSDMPFDIPENWEWTTLQNLTKISTGKKDANYGTSDGQYDFFTCSKDPIKSPTYSFEGECLILAGNGANVGLSIYYNGKFEAYQRTYVVEKLYDFVNMHYLQYVMEWRWKEYNADKMFGSAIPYIKLGNLQNYPIPVPPLAEQERIVAQLDRLLPLCESLSES